MTARLICTSAAALVLACGVSTPPAAVELNPAALAYVTPDKFKWRDPKNAGPNNAVSLYGDASKEGFYVNLTKWNKGNNFSRPHFHPNDRFITVIGGTWWMGSGTTFDPDNSVPLPAGTFVTHFGKQVHWDGAKDEDAVLLIVGQGPATLTRTTITPGKLTGIDSTAVTYKLPDQIKWRDPTDQSPTNQAILHGDPTKPGELYVVINKFKPGSFSRPHFHPNDRFITVIKGSWWVATGNKFDPNNTVRMPTGTFVTHFGKEVHWDGAKGEEAWVLITGIGPSTSMRVPEEK